MIKLLKTLNNVRFKILLFRLLVLRNIYDNAHRYNEVYYKLNKLLVVDNYYFL